MTLPLPTHLVDTMSSATASGVEAASHLLQEVSHAVSTVASDRARWLRRATHRNKSRSMGGRLLIVVGAVGAAALVAVLVQRKMSDRRRDGVLASHDGNPPPSSAMKPERNGTMASAQPDDIKGRIKEAAGALTDNDDLKREGKTDQAAGSVKEGLDKVRDKIEDGIDAIKDRINKD